MGKKIAIIGGGNLGTAIAEGLLKSKFCKATELTVTKRNTAPLTTLKAKGVTITDNNTDAANKSEVILLAVKPFQAAEALNGIKSELDRNKLVISVITGVSISDIQKIAGKKFRVFRAMPNTAIAIQQSMTCISHQQAAADDVRYVNDLFAQLGRVVTIDEKLMDASTILGACGTAYAMRYIRASIQGGIEIGFDAAAASLITAQTVKGAAELLLQRGAHPEQEIDKVTTPRGCTIAGLNEMEHQGFSSSLIRGIVASYKKIAKD
jgi:pyrroline-5-carboxylate reductase